jgi:hypothetical protein
MRTAGVTGRRVSIVQVQVNDSLNGMLVTVPPGVVIFT